MMEIVIKEFKKEDIYAAIEIWNEVVFDGVAFPQTESLDIEDGTEFFLEQSFTALACDKKSGEICGLYILHPNNIGRCGHIANASYAVKGSKRNMRIGETLVRHSLVKAKELGFSIMQFNAVVATNEHALHLYEKIGFTRLGTIPQGFRLKSGEFADIIPQYYVL